MGWKDCMLDPVGCAVGNVAGEAAQSTWDSFTQWVGQGLTDLAATVFATFSESTTPDFGVDWFSEYLDTLILVSLPILALFFVLQVITGVVRREVGYLGRALVGVVIGAAGVPIALALVDAMSTFVDAASAALIREHSPGGFQRMFEVSSLLAAGSAGGFVLVAMFIAIFAMFALYLVLLLRKVALIAIVVFAPLALVGWTWEATRSWLRRWIEVTVALLFSKFAMAVVFSLGLSAIGGAGTDQEAAATIGDLLAGVVLFGIAAFAPWACFHFLHWAGAESATALHRTTHQGASSMRHQTSRAQHAIHRATSTQEHGGGLRTARGHQSSNGVRRAADSTQGPGSLAASSETNGASGGANKGAAGSASGGAGVAGGAIAAVKATHDVAKGIKDAGVQAGDATAQHVQEAGHSESPPSRRPSEASTAERATRPDPSPRREPGR
jgi:hypothetical protein